MRAAAVIWLLAACSAEGDATGPDGGDADGGIDGDAADPIADRLRQRVAGCADLLGGPYAPGSGEPATIDICGFPGAVVWQADLDVDCDGQVTAECNPQTDPYFMNQTAATDSMGAPLDAAALPFVVVPGASVRFDYRDEDLALGSVVAVVYQDRVEYGPLGDVGPAAYIGEASYAMAERLGIDPDPATGGTDDPVLYIAFTGTTGRVEIMEDHAEAAEVGAARVRELLEAP